MVGDLRRRTVRRDDVGAVGATVRRAGRTGPHGQGGSRRRRGPVDLGGVEGRVDRQGARHHGPGPDGLPLRRHVGAGEVLVRGGEPSHDVRARADRESRSVHGHHHLRRDLSARLLRHRRAAHPVPSAPPRGLCRSSGERGDGCRSHRVGVDVRSQAGLDGHGSDPAHVHPGVGVRGLDRECPGTRTRRRHRRVDHRACRARNQPAHTTRGD